MDKRSLKTAGHDDLKLFFIINETAAGTAHRVGRTENDRIAELISDFETFFYTVRYLASGHFNTEHVHGLLELDAVLAALNCVDLNADDLHIVFVQNAFFIKFGSKIETGLSSEIRKQSVRTFFCNDLLKTFNIERLDIRYISHLRVCHDCGRVGVYKYDLVAEAAQCFTGLCAGVVELARLTDYDRAGTNDQNLVNICPLWHEFPPI